MVSVKASQTVSEFSWVQLYQTDQKDKMPRNQKWVSNQKDAFSVSLCTLTLNSLVINIVILYLKNNNFAPLFLWDGQLKLFLFFLTNFIVQILPFLDFKADFYLTLKHCCYLFVTGQTSTDQFTSTHIVLKKWRHYFSWFILRLIWLNDFCVPRSLPSSKTHKK